MWKSIQDFVYNGNPNTYYVVVSKHGWVYDVQYCEKIKKFRLSEYPGDDISMGGLLYWCYKLEFLKQFPLVEPPSED